MFHVPFSPRLWHWGKVILSVAQKMKQVLKGNCGYKMLEVIKLVPHTTTQTFRARAH